MKQRKMKNQARKFGVLSFGIFAFAMMLAIVGLANSVGQFKEEAISKTPEAILASAGLSEGKDVFLSVAYYDQKADECVNLYDVGVRDVLNARQFEWSNCGYYTKKIEPGLVKFELNDKYLPVTQAGELVANRGLGDTERWFDVVEGKSESYTGALKLEYKESGAEFSFQKNEFYPLDEVSFSEGDGVNSDGHNHLFTMNFAVPFTVLKSGKENFEITADDDTFVFVGNKLVIDMGGIHDPTTGRFLINDDGDVYSAVENEELAYSGVSVGGDSDSMVRIFHADRDSSGSEFDIKFSGMSLAVTDSKLANRQDDGVQIAYDPTDPTYTAPLGESVVVRPDGTKGLVVIATVEGVMVVVFTVFMAMAIRSFVKREQKRNK